jgi:hypothetical protein
MAIQIKWRRDTAANWTSNNPVLAQGEPGFETDTGAYKIGNGSSTWSSLAYGSYSSHAIAALFADQISGNDPSAPASGKLIAYGKTIANRMMLKQIGPSGLATAIQPFLGRNRVGYWNPPGNAATLPEVFGYTAPTAIGNAATAANVATTNIFTMMRRLSYTSVSGTAASYGGQRVSQAQITMQQGFYKITRFGISDASLVSPANMFIGVSSTTGAPSGGTDPSALLNLIGVGHASTDTNLKIFYGGTTSQTPIDLGANFPINTVDTDAYELALFSPPGNDYNAYYEVTRINTGNVASGVIVGDGGGAVLPAPALLLTYGWHWRSNSTSTAAVSLDIMSDYIETDS